jgi:hypothetical protein
MENIKVNFVSFIESKTKKKLVLPFHLAQTLDNAIEVCFNVTVDFKRIYGNCTEEQFFDYIFQQWKADFRLISAPHLGTGNTTLIIMGVQLPISQDLVNESENLFAALEAQCGFQKFDFP